MSRAEDEVVRDDSYRGKASQHANPGLAPWVRSTTVGAPIIALKDRCEDALHPLIIA
jgi:hypothetical protein